MKKIAILKSRLSFLGGLERYAIAIAQAFARRGCNVEILTTGDTLDIPHVKVNSLKEPSFSSIASIYSFDKAASQWLQTHHYDAVFGLDRNINQTHYRAGNGMHLSFLKQRHPKFLSRCLSYLNPKNQLILTKEKKLFQNPNLKVLFVNSKMIRDEILSHYQIDSNKIKVVHNGVDFKKYVFDHSSQVEMQLRLSLDPSSHQFLFIGNGYQRKGLTLLLEALAKLNHSAFELSVIGHDKNIAAYKLLAKKLKLKKKIHFFGPQQNLLPFYQAADCLVLPTRYDPFANVTIEAVACGLYVITTEQNGAKEVLDPSLGTIIAQNTLNAHVLEKAMMQKKDYQTRVARRKLIQHLDINSQLDKIVDFTLN